MSGKDTPFWVWRPWDVHVKLFGSKRNAAKCAYSVASNTRDPLPTQCQHKPVDTHEGFPVCRRHKNRLEAR